MKLHLYALGCILLAPTLVRAQTLDPSIDRLNMLDARGYFTPRFKKAVHDLVDTQHALAQSRTDIKKWNEELPELQKQSAEATMQVTRLRAELAVYTHPENADFDALQRAMKNPNIGPKERLALAQAFVWSYPTDPRQTEAEADLQQTQQLLTAQQAAVLDAATARTAAHARLIQRVQTRSLSLPEWRTFLREMSQEDLLKYLGRPQDAAAGYWIYSGNFIVPPGNRPITGLRINFNGTRVISVAPLNP